MLIRRSRRSYYLLLLRPGSADCGELTVQSLLYVLANRGRLLLLAPLESREHQSPFISPAASDSVERC